MKQKIIAIYFSLSGAMDYPFDTPRYFESYKDIIADLREQGVRTVIVRGASYLGKKRFSHYFEFEDGVVVKRNKKITVDLIFNRDNENTIPYIEDCPIINQPDFDELCVDKYKTAQLFPDISPRTAYVHSFEQCRASVNSWRLTPNSKIVLKKNYLHSGRGIYVVNVSEIAESLYDDWTDIVMQEFKDSSAGLPGVVDGPHDLRIYVINNRVLMGMVRTPKPGTWIANVPLGGQSQTVRVDQIEPAALRELGKISEKFFHYRPSLYAADFLRDSSGTYWLIELNSRPTVPSAHWEQYAQVKQAFVQLLTDTLDSL